MCTLECLRTGAGYWFTLWFSISLTRINRCNKCRRYLNSLAFFLLTCLPDINILYSTEKRGVAESVTTVAAAGEILRRDASRDGSDSRARFIGMGEEDDRRH